MLWGLTCVGETASQGRFLETLKDLPANTPFICEPAHPEPKLPDYLLYWILRYRATSPTALITSEPDIKQFRTIHTPQSLLELFKLANFKSACLALPNIAHTNHNKGIYPHFPLLSLHLRPTHDSHADLSGMPSFQLLKICEHKISFLHHSYFHVYGSYHKTN